MKNIKSITISMITATLLIGCGSSSRTTEVSEISGNVADGYLVGAKVCLDKNDNEVCEDQEPSTITGVNGKYTLSNIPLSDIDRYPLLVEVNQSVIDEDDNLSVNGSYTLSAPVGEKFISPISTMVKQEMKNNSLDKQSAKNSIATKLGINDSELIFEDYIKSNKSESSSLHNIAKVVANLKIKIQEDIDTQNTSKSSTKDLNSYINNKIIDEFPIITSELNSSVVDIQTHVNNVFANMDFSNASSELIDSIDDDKDSLFELVQDQTIDQNKNYTKVYNGGTDLTTYTINKNDDKICTLNILDTTNSANPYGQSYSINGSSSSPTTSYSLGTDSSFSIGWKYFTVENSHLDFNVTCEDKPQNTTTALETKYMLDIPYYDSVGYETESFFYRIELDKEDQNRTIWIYGNRNSNNNPAWQGFSLTLNGEVWQTYTGDDEIQPLNIDSILLTYNKETEIATCVIKDRDDNILSTLTKSTPLNIFGKVDLGYFIGKINHDSTTLVYSTSLFSTLER